MDVDAAPLADAAAPDAAAGASDLQLDALREWLGSVSEAVRADAKKAACYTNAIRFEQSRRARGNPPEFTLERFFGTTDVDAINALSEEAYQGALAKAGFSRAASLAKSTATQAKKRRAGKEANNGKHPKFKANPSCPDFEAEKGDYQKSFGAHLKKCSSCRNWAYKVYQLQAAPVGVYPKTLSVVKCAAKVQEKGVKFPGRIDVADFRARRDAAAKATKRKGATGAAPPAKKAKK